MRLFTPLRTALAAAVLVATGAALAQQPTGPGTGLPMWVIRDADSTIYLTGTIHMLPDDIKWRSPKLDAALKQAPTLWLELAEIQDVAAFRAKAGPVLMRYGKSDGPTPSSLLTEKENTQLKAAFEKAGMTAEQMTKMDGMKPWFAYYSLSSAMMRDSALSSDNGIDEALARIALADGNTVKGMETIETQAATLASPTIEVQLKQLRQILSAPPGAAANSARISEMAYRSWANGETNMVEALMTFMALGTAAVGGSTDALLKDRNEHWAAEIEDMLKGSGVAVIAVGAGHLAGPDSLQTRLALRGIKAERY